MKNIIGIILLTSFSVLVSCCKHDRNSENRPLFDITFVEEQQTTKLSELFPDARLVKLETNDSSLVGTRNMKVIFRDGVFYIRSLNEIIMFDADGNYIGKLSHQGGGPGEYDYISDFDIVDYRGHKEIWIPDFNEILRYAADTKKHLGTIKLQDGNTKFGVNDIFFVNDSSILVTTNDSLYFKTIDDKGNIRREFLELDFANSAHSSIAFHRLGNMVYNQINGTNEAAVYYIDADTFGMRPIINPNDRFVTMKANTDAYESQGMMGQHKYIKENYIEIMCTAAHGNDALINFSTPDGKKYLGVSRDGKTQFYIIDDGTTIENDLVPESDPRFPITIIACHNDNGFIMELDTDNEENPYLLVIE